jgi:hypothetical protein
MRTCFKSGYLLGNDPWDRPKGMSLRARVLNRGTPKSGVILTRIEYSLKFGQLHISAF